MAFDRLCQTVIDLAEMEEKENAEEIRCDRCDARYDVRMDVDQSGPLRDGN